MCASVLGPGTYGQISEPYHHANMVVLGNHYFIFEITGRTCNIQPFSTELGISADVPIVDVEIAYDCMYMKTHTC